MHFVNLCPNLAVGCHVENPCSHNFNTLLHAVKLRTWLAIVFLLLLGFLLDMVEEAVTVGCCITNAVVMSPR